MNIKILTPITFFLFITLSGIVYARQLGGSSLSYQINQLNQLNQTINQQNQINQNINQMNQINQMIQLNQMEQMNQNINQRIQINQDINQMEQMNQILNIQQQISKQKRAAIPPITNMGKKSGKYQYCQPNCRK